MTEAMGDHDSCFVFTPNEALQHPDRTPKRRKLEPKQQLASHSVNPTARLLKGHESSEVQGLRLKASQRLWKSQETSLEAVLLDINRMTAASVGAFIREKSRSSTNGKIPMGLLVSKPGNTVPSSLLGSAIEQARIARPILQVEISASQYLNTKSIVRSINDQAIAYAHRKGQATSNDSISTARPLNYDFQILNQCVLRNGLQHVLVLVQDSEAIDANTMTDLLELLCAWRKRVPFFLFFGIQTSVDLFESKLPDHLLQELDGQSFQVEDVKMEDIFKKFNAVNLLDTTLATDVELSFPRRRLWIGPNLSRRIMARQSQHIVTAPAFKYALKDILISHFFANALSIALDDEIESFEISVQHAYAIRCLPSFHRYCQMQFDVGKFEEVERLIFDDSHLHQVFLQELTACSELLQRIGCLVDALFNMQHLLLKDKASYVELYAAGMSGQLADSRHTIAMMSALHRASSNNMVPLLNELYKIPTLKARIAPLRDSHNLFRAKHEQSHQSDWRSGHDLNSRNIRTTVVAHKVELGQQASNLTKEEKAYTAILDDIYDLVTNFFAKELENPQTAFPVEALMYDLLTPSYTIAGSQVRQALERGLHQCHDYLGHECCDHGNDPSLAELPSTATLYNLYLECNDAINVADLWSAFSTVTKPDVQSEEQHEHDDMLGSFETGLAELRYLGMLKSNRKKADCLTKAAWKGL